MARAATAGSPARHPTITASSVPRWLHLVPMRMVPWRPIRPPFLDARSRRIRSFSRFFSAVVRHAFGTVRTSTCGLDLPPPTVLSRLFFFLPCLLMPFKEVLAIPDPSLDAGWSVQVDANAKSMDVEHAFAVVEANPPLLHSPACLDAHGTGSRKREGSGGEDRRGEGRDPRRRALGRAPPRRIGRPPRGSRGWVRRRADRPIGPGFSGVSVEDRGRSAWDRSEKPGAKGEEPHPSN
eukprot:scaffold285_cov330-Pavlova_lutheri.AAC.52